MPQVGIDLHRNSGAAPTLVLLQSRLCDPVGLC
jgi:hypothetical protein